MWFGTACLRILQLYKTRTAPPTQRYSITDLIPRGRRNDVIHPSPIRTTKTSREGGDNAAHLVSSIAVMSFFGGGKSAEPRPAVQIQVAEEEPHSFYLNQNKSSTPSHPNPHATPFEPSHPIKSLVDVGIFKDTIAPSFALHGSLAVAVWGVGRATNRAEAKDWLCENADIKHNAIKTSG